ncbi:MAG: hypothetical protein QME46_11945 [Thermoanaerobacteraceae bacterium]|jgi:hypothetical protein|nr:hypothetical protein [Thermoanaerobacteraceae bacterium]
MVTNLYNPVVREEGIKEGIRKGKISDIENAIRVKLDRLPEDLKEKIENIKNEEKLNELLITVIKSDSIDEVYKKI